MKSQKSQQLEQQDTSANPNVGDVAAEALRQSEARFRLIYEHTATGVAITDVNGRFVQCNPSYCSMLGYTEAELKKLDLPLLIHHDDQEENMNLFRRLRAGEIPSFEIENRYVAKSGATVWVHKSVSLLRDAAGNPTNVFALVTNITARKQAEEQIERGFSSLQLLVNSIPAFVSYVDAGERYRLVNRKYEDYFRMPAAQIVGKHLRELQSPEAYAQMQPHVRAALAGESVHFQLNPPGPDGQSHYFDVQYIPRKENGGNVSGFFVLVFDMTERKRGDEALRDSEERYRVTFENAAVGISNVAPDGRWLRVNDRLCEIVGYSREELLKKTFADITHPDDIEADWKRVRSLLAGEISTYSMDKRYIRKDGLPVWIALTVSLIRRPNGEPDYFISIVRDIDALKQAEAALRESEERFRLFMDNSPTVTWVKDQDGRFIYFSRAYEQRFGVRLADWRGKTDAELWPLDIAETFRRNDLAVLESDRPKQVIEETRNADGSSCYWLSTKFPFRDAAGKRYVAGIALDITDSKKIEEELQRAKANAEEANRAKDNFLAVLGHELRNPLAPIRNSVAILKHAERSEAMLVRARDVIDRQVTHMSRLIDDLLDVSRLARGKIVLRKEAVNLVAKVKTIIEDHRADLDAAGIELEFQPSQEAIWILGDKVRLAQIVGNLLSNAVKFTDRGGRVTIRLGTTPEMQATISVCDTGIGMDATALEYIFKPFAQSERSIDRSHGGLGLGLALVHDLVELHGGTVRVSSPGMGKGAEFVVTLPGITKAPTVKTALPAAAPAAGSRRILVIEDNIDAAESLRHLFEMYGHAVDVAYTGPDGLELARARRPEVVFCDIGLPGMTGYDIASAIRKDAELRSAYLVAMTGFGQNEDRKRAHDAGFDRHLTKPADADELLRLLAR